MVFEKVRSIIAQQLEIPEERIEAASRLNEDLDADSVEVVGIIMNLEAEFGMEFPYENLDAIKTVGDAVAYIESRVQ